MSILENAIKHAGESHEIIVPVPEWDCSLYFRKPLSIKDYSSAVRAIATYDFKPLCKILATYAETESGEKAFPELDDAYKLEKAVSPAVVVRTVSQIIPSPEPIEATVKN